MGHAGTLDPLATGVLLLVLGDATRLSQYLMDTPKSYCAEVVLGATTETDDGEGSLRDLADATHLTEANIHHCLQRFRGEIAQVPPAYAAVHHGGEKMYKLARRGVRILGPARRVQVHHLEMISWHAPRLRLRVICGSGTYIRSIARDLGSALGVGGYLHALRRIASGTFSIRDCLPLESVSDVEAVRDNIAAPDRAVLDWPAVVLDDLGVRAVCHGQAVGLGRSHVGQVRLYDEVGHLLALGRADGALVRPFRVFQRGP